ncbi:hypothetical protein [Streptomyces sp. NPDC093589]|uniref:hypothetical protein n=1 Tax=Streptomyces sp. NPDC093589 TaxID=3366043 RepID=UPI003828C61C
MRKVTAGTFLSLDGIAGAPETWQFPYFNDEMGAVVQAQIPLRLAGSTTLSTGVLSLVYTPDGV